MDHRYSSEALKHAAYLHNMTTKTALQKHTPYEMLFGNLPNNAILRKFGCAVYLHVPRATSNNKLSNHAEPGIYLGYTNALFRVRAWRTNRVMETKHVSIDEGIYPRQKNVSYVTIEDPNRERISWDQVEQTQRNPLQLRKQNYEMEADKEKKQMKWRPCKSQKKIV